MKFVHFPIIQQYAFGAVHSMTYMIVDKKHPHCITSILLMMFQNAIDNALFYNSIWIMSSSPHRWLIFQCYNCPLKVCTLILFKLIYEYLCHNFPTWRSLLQKSGMMWGCMTGFKCLSLSRWVTAGSSKKLADTPSPINVLGDIWIAPY